MGVGRRVALPRSPPSPRPHPHAAQISPYANARQAPALLDINHFLQPIPKSKSRSTTKEFNVVYLLVDGIAMRQWDDMMKMSERRLRHLRSARVRMRACWVHVRVRSRHS